MNTPITISNMPYTVASMIKSLSPTRIPIDFDDNGDAIMAISRVDLSHGFSLEFCEYDGSGKVFLCHGDNVYSLFGETPEGLISYISGIEDMDEKQVTELLDVVRDAYSYIECIVEGIKLSDS